jgi:hypothetical protein
VSAALIAAGCIALLATAIHGVVGDRIVVQRLSRETLAASRFGGPRMTKAMIHVSWHITTFAFFLVAVALLLAGSVLDGDAKRALALLAAAGFTGYALIAIGIGAYYNRSPRNLLRHPAPAVLGTGAALAWLGAL